MNQTRWGDSLTFLLLLLSLVSGELLQEQEEWGIHGPPQITTGWWIAVNMRVPTLLWEDTTTTHLLELMNAELNI